MAFYCTQLSQFLHMMEDLGVIKVKETMKGVECITEVDFEHRLLKELSEVMTPPSASAEETVKKVRGYSS